MHDHQLDLPDVNVWLALTDHRHAHHLAARDYWNEKRALEVAFCRVTMLALLRLVTHPKVMANDPFTHEEAWEMYRTYRNLPIIRFLEDPENLDVKFADLSIDSSLPHRLWTDAYLASLAMVSGARMVSFDADFERFPNLELLRLKA
jgi:toxin-antitoxin system PIN domain toxin